MRKVLFTTMSILILASMVLAGCATATPETVVQTVEVEKEVVVTQEVVVEVPAEAAAEEGAMYERSETLYTSGTQWGPPSSWNPFNRGGYAMGTVGLCYETLFLYDPLTNEFTPWLAESGDWASDTEYVIKLREGVKFTDGEDFNAEDAIYTFEVAKDAPVFYTPLWDWLESVEAVDDYNLKFTFSEPLYQEWANYLYMVPMLPEHLWASKSAEEVASGVNENPVGTGPYVYETHDQSRMVWVKSGSWWAIDALGLDTAPKRIVDIVNGSNNVALGLVLQGGLDLSNNFLPGIATLVDGGYGVETYYPEAPYMLSANTAWLVVNNQKAPMDDPAFRRAIATAIDVNQIVSVVYGNIVQAASPSGLLPIWSDYIDQAAVDELGFSYDPEAAKQILADAGYKDVDGDGFVENLDGSPIELSVIVPNGWTDWMESIKVISNSCQAVGINLNPEYPDYGGFRDGLLTGEFDMAIDNQPQASNTPWSYYDWIFQNPIEDIQSMAWGNYGRYDNQEVFDLVTELDKTPVDDTETMKELVSQIQRIQMEDMPIIPLWYNGMWAQTSSAVWTNWPSSADDANHYLPTSWRDYWNMTGILMLTEVEPAPPAE